MTTTPVQTATLTTYSDGSAQLGPFTPVPAPPTPAAPIVSVYVGAPTAAGSVTQAATTFLASVGITDPARMGAMVFLDGSTPESIGSSWGNWIGATLEGWQGTLTIGLPMLAKSDKPANFAAITNGSYDQYLTEMFTAVKAFDPYARFRPGWEPNGDWYLWSYTNYQGNPANPADPSGYAAAFAHIVTLGRSICPTFKFVFNPTRATSGSFSVGNPGAEYIDEYDLDLYDCEWDKVPTDPSELTLDETEALGLNSLVAQAKADGKPWGLAEMAPWVKASSGTEGPGDDPTWVTGALGYCLANGCAFIGLYDVPAWSADFPESLAAAKGALAA